MSESVIRIKLGGRSNAFIAESLPLLLERGILIEIEHKGARLRVSNQRGGTMMAAVPLPPPAAAASDATKPKGPNPGGVPSPMVGTVFAAPEPGAPPFIKVGQTIKEGDTLFIVEAMKTMNPILASRGGTVMEICVSDAEPVEFGQILAIIN